MPKTHFSARIFSRFGHARRGMRRAAAAAAALLMLLCAALPAYAEGTANADTGYALPDGMPLKLSDKDQRLLPLKQTKR